MNNTAGCDIELFYVVCIFFIQRSQGSATSRTRRGLKDPKPQRHCMTMIIVKQ